MKKNIKKCFALLLAVVMTLTMAMTVSAAVKPLTGTKEVTVDGTNGATYKFYKVADVAVSGDAYKYTIVAPFTNDPTITPKYLASVTDATSLQSLATRLGTLVRDNAVATLNYNDADNNTKFVKLEPGYYLMVADPTGTKLTAANSLFTVLTDNVTITPKTSDVTMTKKIVDNYDGTNPRDTSTANVDDNIIYRIETTVPSYGAGVQEVKYWITDNPSKGLTINQETANIIVKDNGSEVDPSNYSVVWNEDGGFTLKFKSEWVLANGNKTIDTYFTAKLNNDAVIGNVDNNKLSDYDGTNEPNPDQSYNEGNPNGAKLEYSNDFTTGNGSETIKDEVTTFTFELKVKKVGADAPEVGLKDAEFTVYTDSDCNQVYGNGKFNGVLKTGEDGTVTAEGFKDGTYYIKETKAPKDYNLYEGTIIVRITANHDQTSNEYDGKYKYTITMDGTTTEGDINKDKVVTVIDQKGLTLPGTGGIGTTLFTFGGIALILIAGVMFIVYTRKQKKQS